MTAQTTWIDPESAQGGADDALRGWDWMAELGRQERTIPWLARKTGRAQTTVYRYKYGSLTPPVTWLRAARTALGLDVAA